MSTEARSRARGASVSGGTGIRNFTLRSFMVATHISPVLWVEPGGIDRLAPGIQQHGFLVRRTARIGCLYFGVGVGASGERPAKPPYYHLVITFSIGSPQKKRLFLHRTARFSSLLLTIPLLLFYSTWGPPSSARRLRRGSRVAAGAAGAGSSPRACDGCFASTPVEWLDVRRREDAMGAF
jgi:hypothetical protein